MSKAKWKGSSVIFGILSKLSKDDSFKWYTCKLVGRVQHIVNSTYNRSINMTSFELLVGLKMRTTDDFDIKNVIEGDMRQQYEEARAEISQHAKKTNFEYAG